MVTMASIIRLLDNTEGPSLAPTRCRAIGRDVAAEIMKIKI